MDDERARLVETFGYVIGSMMNWPPINGRVMLTIMLSDRALTAEELRDELGISAGSVSESTRSLIESGVIERIVVEGSRKRAYQWRHDAWVACAAHTAGNYHPMRDLVLRTNAGAKEAGMTALQQERFERMAEFYSFMCATFDSFAVDVKSAFERSGTYSQSEERSEPDD